MVRDDVDLHDEIPVDRADASTKASWRQPATPVTIEFVTEK